MIVLIAFTVLFYVGGVILVVFLYIDYHSAQDIIAITITVIGMIAYTVLSVGPWKTDSGSLFTCSIVFVYTTFFCWSALLSGVESIGLTVLQVCIGLGFLVAALFFISCYEKKEGEGNGNLIEQVNAPAMEQKGENEHEPLAGDGGAGYGSREPSPLDGQTGAEDLPAVSLKTAYFHLIMVFASLYMAMLITNWGLPTIGDETSTYFTNSPELSYWIQVSSQWIVILLFIWTLIAEKVCKDRDFTDS